MGIFNKKNKKVFNQDLSSEAKFENVYMIHLLFEDKPIKPNSKVIKEALDKKFGQCDIISGNEGLTTFSINKYSVEFKEGKLPPQLVMADVHEFNGDSISEFDRQQLWNVENSEELLSKCKYELFIFDIMSSGLEYKERSELLMDWLEVAVEIFPECKAVWIKPSRKLFEASEVRSNNIPRDSRFVYFGVNARFFNIQGTNDSIVDTLGLYAIGLPDLQYHFNTLDPNLVVNHAYNLASYIYSENAPIKNGETIDGINNGELDINTRWYCQYEDALIQPSRIVMDVLPNQFAAGKREN